MNSTPVGVEEKAESRFVDYTIASDFEKLVSTVEGLFKGWMKDIESAKGSMDGLDLRGSLDLGETKLILSLHSHCADKPVMPLPLWFNLKDGSLYAVISKLRVWSTFTASERKYLLSAVVSGLNSTGFSNLSVFTTASDLDNIVNSPEVDGYCSRNIVMSKLCNVEHYESVRLTGVDVRHPFSTWTACITPSSRIFRGGLMSPRVYCTGVLGGVCRYPWKKCISSALTALKTRAALSSGLGPRRVPIKRIVLGALHFFAEPS